MDAACPNHPEVPALGNCQRCGTFFCALDRVDVDGVAYCQTCGVRPDVDWIEAYRKKYLGRRDAYAWFMGGSTLVWLFVTAILAANVNGSSKLLALPSLACAITAALFFFGKRIARPLVIGTVLVWGTILLVTVGPWTLIPTALLLAVLGLPLNSTRTRLFFQLDVPRGKLRRDYEQLVDNRLARTAAALGVFGLAFPPVAPIALVCGIFAYRRVDPTAKPPVGQAPYAIAGIVLGVVDILAAVMWIALLRNR